MKCLFDMTIEDLECICQSLYLKEWRITDTYNNEYANNRANYILKNNRSKFYGTYMYLVEQASIKDIYKNGNYYIQKDPRNYNFTDPNIEIISWMDSLSIMNIITQSINKNNKKEVNIIMEYCLSKAKTFEINNNQITKQNDDPLLIENYLNNIYNTELDNRIDYILTYKNIMYIIEFTEIGSNVKNKINEINNEKQTQIEKYTNLIKNYLTKEQKEILKIKTKIIKINTYDYNNIDNQIYKLQNEIINELLNTNNTTTNLAYNILRTINNYIPPEIQLEQ